MAESRSSSGGFTWRAAAVAVFLTLILLGSSTYIALKIGALPWPIIFSVIVSGGLIKLLGGRARVNLHEVNVAQAGASIGGLVAAGIAFTVPGILFLNQAQHTEIPWPNPLKLGLLTTAAGLLGVLLAVPLKETFVDREQLPYPAGTAGAELLKLGGVGGKPLLRIILAGVAAGIFALLRDLYFPGGWSVAFLVPVGIQLTLLPMPLAIGSGYILGQRAALSWFGGAAIGWLILVPSLLAGGLPAASARAWIQNLGMGLVLGSGMGFFFSYILPRARKVFRPMAEGGTRYWRLLPYLIAAALLGLLISGVPFLSALLAIAGVWMMVAVAARMTGETNINPLEQFGIFIGLVIALIYQFAGLELSMFASFTIITFVSVATAVAGDAGHDFKSAALVGTRFMDVVKVDLIAALAAGAAAPFFMEVIRIAFAGQLFTDAMPAPQARLVAGSIFGFEFPRVFMSGLLLAFLGETLGNFLPEKLRGRVMIMPLGIGLFLGLGLAIPLAIGGLLRAYIDRRRPHLYQGGLLIAAGVMGGEGIAGFSAGALVSAGVPFAEGSWALLAVLALVAVFAALGLRKAARGPH